MKIYGNEKTSLELSAKAQSAYELTDPLKIIEEDDGSYTMTGAIACRGISADKVNQILESFYDECFGDV